MICVKPLPAWERLSKESEPLPLRPGIATIDAPR
jgi:hypothetical protein